MLLFTSRNDRTALFSVKQHRCCSDTAAGLVITCTVFQYSQIHNSKAPYAYVVVSNTVRHTRAICLLVKSLSYNRKVINSSCSVWDTGRRTSVYESLNKKKWTSFFRLKHLSSVQHEDVFCVSENNIVMAYYGANSLWFNLEINQWSKHVIAQL